MAILPILSYPDPRLRLPCRPVEVFDARLATLADDLAATMRAAPGIGITAAHVGILERLTVIELDGPGSLKAYVNPRIEWFSPEKQRHTEPRKSFCTKRNRLAIFLEPSVPTRILKRE